MWERVWTTSLQVITSSFGQWGTLSSLGLLELGAQHVAVGSPSITERQTWDTSTLPHAKPNSLDLRDSLGHFRKYGAFT